MPQNLANPTRRQPSPFATIGTFIKHAAPQIGPDGAYWIVTTESSQLNLKRSTDKGASWTVIATSAGISGGVVDFSWVMDVDGNVHCSAGTGSSFIEYHFFRFTNYATQAVSVGRFTITGQSGTSYYQAPRIAAFKVALGWAVGILYKYWTGGNASILYYNLYLDTAGNAISGGAESGTYASTGSSSISFGEVQTKHNGDGFTPDSASNPAGLIGVQWADGNGYPYTDVAMVTYSAPTGTQNRGTMAWSAGARQYFGGGVLRFGAVFSYRWTGRRLVMTLTGDNGGGNSNFARNWLFVSPVGSMSLSQAYYDSWQSGTSVTQPTKPGWWGSYISVDEDAAGTLLMVGNDSYLPQDGGTDRMLVWRKFDLQTGTYSGWGLIYEWVYTSSGGVNSFAYPAIRVAVGNSNRLDVAWLRQTQDYSGTAEINLSYYQMTQMPTVTVTAPTSGAYLDFTDAQPFTWTIAVDPFTQAPVNGVAFKRTSSGNVDQWWDGTQWVGTETFITATSARTGIAFPAGAWGANGSSYTWSVKARNADGTGPATNTRVVTGRAKPTAQWEEPDPNEAFAITGPVLEWSGTAASGTSLDGAQVRILFPGQYQPADPTAGTATWEKTYSSWVTSEDLPGGTLQDGNPYVALLRSRQGGSQWSLWQAQSFTVALQPVNTPSVALTVATSGTPRLDVQLSWIRGTAVGQGYVTFQRSLDGQATWQTLATLDAGTTGNASLSYTDADLPTGQVAAYRARAVTTIGDESTASQWSPVQSAAFSVYADYFVNLVTLKSSVARLQVYEHAARPWQGEVVYPLEGDQAIILSGRQYRREGSAVAAFRTWPAALAFEEALLGINPLLWRRPVDSSGWQRPDATIRVRPGSVRVHPADPSFVRWAACLVDFDWITQ